MLRKEEITTQDRKSRMLSVAMFCMTTLVPISHCVGEEVQTAQSQDHSKRSFMLQIGGNYTHVIIKPSTTPAFNGDLGGVQGIFEYRPMHSFYESVKAMWREGNTTNHAASRFLFDVDVQERFGYTMASSCERYSCTFFTGFGYRYLGHKLTQNQFVFHLNYNEFYIPVGFLTDFKISSLISMGVFLTWMPQVNPTVVLVPIGDAQWVIKKRLANFLVELPLNFCIGGENRFFIIFKPFYEHWQDGPSTIATTTNVALGLPGNSYNFWGAELNFGYKF